MPPASSSVEPPEGDARGSRLTVGMRTHLWQIQGVRDVLLIGTIAAIIYVGYWLREVTVPLLVALALAYLFEPIVRRFAAMRWMTRPRAVTILLLTVGTITMAAVLLATPLVVGQTVRLVSQVRDFRFAEASRHIIRALPAPLQDEAQSALDWLTQQWQAGTGESQPESAVPESEQPEEAQESKAAAQLEPERVERLDEDQTRDLVREIVREELASSGFVDAASLATPATPRTMAGTMRILGLVGPTAQGVIDLLLAILRLSLLAFLIPFYFYFFSVYYPQIVQFCTAMVPEARRERTAYLVGRMDRAVSGFIRGRIVVCTIMGALFAIGWIFCGVPYAIALGLFVGAISIVPYLGGIGLPLALGFLIFEQVQLPPELRMGWWTMLLWPTLVFVAVQILETYILTPIITGKAADLDPVTIVVAILAGGSVAGVYGMLLAIPGAACGKILLTESVLPSIRAWARGEAADPLPITAEGVDESHPQRPNEA